MASAAAGGGEDGKGDGNRDSSHHSGKITFETPHDPKKMSTLERGMLRYMQGKNCICIARREEPPWDALYAPPDMHHYLQRRTADAIARGEEPPYGGLYAPGGRYAPPAEPCVANPPTTKPTKEVKPSSSCRRKG
jgi:hypothetical protein